MRFLAIAVILLLTACTTTLDTTSAGSGRIEGIETNIAVGGHIEMCEREPESIFCEE